jgi:DNA repair protein REV1
MILYNTLVSYTLDIEAVSCDEMYVDITDILTIFNLSVEGWATHIRNEIMSKTGCPCSTGFGANRLQARLATKKAKPAGSYHLKPEDVEVYMAEIAVADLPGVGRATLQKLKALGLETCGDVQVASLQVLQKELGVKAGETILEQARGLDRKPLNFHHERKSVSAEINYGIRFKSLEECHNFLESLGNEVWSRLKEVKMRARCVTVKLMVRAADAPVVSSASLEEDLS